MTAVDELRAMLAAIYVPPHVRHVGGHIVKVEGYVRRTQGGASPLADRMATPSAEGPPDEPKITRVIRVKDTREWDDDREPPVPIPGSGDAKPCDRCNRMHEVHVYVQLDNGAEAVIGSGCARQTEMAMVSKAVASAKTVDRLEHQLQVARERAEVADEAWNRVLAMPRPEIRRFEETKTSTSSGREYTSIVWEMGDARVWLPPDSLDPEREQERIAAVTETWMQSRWLEAMGLEHGTRWSYAQVVEDLEKRLKRARKRLEAT